MVSTESPEPEYRRLAGTTFRGNEIVESPVSEDAERRIFLSFVIAGAGSALAFVLAKLEGAWWIQAVVTAAAALYLVWATYWGVLRTHALLRDWGGRDSHDSFVEHLVVSLVLERFGLFGLYGASCLAGAAYGVAGGAFWEFWVCRKIAKVPNVLPTRTL